MASSSSSSSVKDVVVSPATDALVIVDMQNDFLLETAPLLVPNGVALLHDINAVSRRVPFRCQVATMDWHPPNHCSFKAQGGPWPVHCVRGSHGAQLHAGLHTHHLHACLHKGTTQASDSYSAFADENRASTGLAGFLSSLGVTRVFVCGVAYDYCVFQTAMDAKACGFDVVVVSDLCAAIDTSTAQKRTSAMQAAGVLLRRKADLTSGQALPQLRRSSL